MELTRWDQDQARIRAICARLTSDCVVEPLADRPDDDRAWNGWELASLIEGNFGQQIDVGTLNEQQRAQWELSASWDHHPLPRPHSEYNLSHWLLEDGARVGTISFATMFKALALFNVSSLFVVPAFRGRGIARRALEAAYSTALAVGASGLVLSTPWTWQSSVRFYLHIGMWVRMWKRGLQLMWGPELPAYQVEIGTPLARFLVETVSGFEPWLEAEPKGERLGWRELPAYRALAEDKAPPEGWYDAVGTFALHLAIAGWPLIRSDELWREQRYADAGPPESLAYKIEVFEAVARRDGFVVPTPRIPNVAYRDLDDID
ncbi:MAG: GNAT family N-acetyltransferase [Thermoanaerobaculia bacterium]